MALKIPQSLDLGRKGRVGFDILDVITPLGTIHTHIKHLHSWGHGWEDLIPSHNCRQRLRRPYSARQPRHCLQSLEVYPRGHGLCGHFCSTLKMLYEKQLQRIEPGLGVGEIPSKITWVTSCQPFKPFPWVEEIVHEH
ncbi:hypothetical protein RJZ57_004708 [Blastomyces gilchristii]